MKKQLFAICALFAVLLAGACTPEQEPVIPPAPDPLSFEITKSSGPDSVSVQVVPSSSEVPFFFDIMTEEDLNASGGDMEKLPTYLLRRYYKGEITQDDLLSGEQKKVFRGLSLNTTYYIVAVGVYDEAMSGSAVEEVITQEWEEDEYQLHIRPVVKEVGLDYIDIDITVDDESQYYLAMPYTIMEIPTEVDPGEEEAANKWIFEKIQSDVKGFCDDWGLTFENFLKQYEGELSFRGSKVISSEKLPVNFDQGVYIVGVDKDFNKISDLHRVVFKTLKAPVDEMTFEVTPEIDGRNVSLSIHPEDQESRWCILTFEKERWESMTSVESDEYVFESNIRNMYLFYGMTNPEMTHEDKINELTHIGDFVYTKEEKYSDSEYVYVLAKFIEGRSSLYISSLATVGSYRTGKVDQSECEFNFETSNITVKSVDVNVSPSDATVAYTFDVVPLGEWKNMSGEEIIAQYVLKNKASLNAGRNIFTGDQSKSFEIVPDTEYAVIAFGYKDGGANTELGMTTFTSEASGDASACTFDVSIDELVQTSMKYSVTPSSDIVYWQSGIEEADAFDAAAVKTDIEKAIVNKVKWSSKLNYCTAQAVDELSEMGALSEIKNKSKLASGTKYVLWVAAVGTDGHCMEPVITEFETKKFGGGEATVEVIADKYYDSMLADFIPGITPNEYDAVIPVEITASSNATGVFWLFRVGYNLENVSDEEILNDLTLRKISDGSVIQYTNAPYDQEFTLVIGAKDANGQYGPLFKKYMKLTKSGVSPIEELEEYYNSHK